jgi:hypothetical protein
VKKIIILLVIIGASLLAAVLTPKHLVSFLHEHFAYYFIFVSFFLWLTYLSKLYFKQLKSIFLNHYGGLLLSTILIGLIFCIAPPKFKVLSDETNLIGISMDMHQSKKATLPIKGFNLDYRPPDYTRIIDKRPLLYPLLVSFVHSLRGYSAYNGFVLNFLLGIGVLFVFYLLVCDHFSRFYAYLGILMVASTPLFVIWVTSSGFETLNLFFIVFTLFLFSRVLAGKNIQNAELLFLTLVLLAQCRYESAVFTVAVLFLLPMFLNKEAISKLSIITYITPVLFIPVVWLPRLYAGLPDINRVNEALIQAPSLYEAFSFSNLAANSPKNLVAFLGLDPYLGFTPVISALSVAGVYLLTKKLITDYQNQSARYKTMWAFGAVTFGLLYFIQFSFYRGDLTIFTQNRFAMTYLPFMVIPAIFFVHEILNNSKTDLKIVVVIFFVLHLLYFWPYGSQQRHTNVGLFPYEYNKTLQLLKDQFNSNSNLLVISDRPNVYLIQFKGAVDYEFANQNPDAILNRYLREFDHVIVLQRFSYQTHTPLSANRLSNFYRLKELRRINLTREIYLKIFEIIDPEFSSHHVEAYRN